MKRFGHLSLLHVSSWRQKHLPFHDVMLHVPPCDPNGWLRRVTTTNVRSSRPPQPAVSVTFFWSGHPSVPTPRPHRARWTQSLSRGPIRRARLACLQAACPPPRLPTEPSQGFSDCDLRPFLLTTLPSSYRSKMAKSKNHTNHVSISIWNGDKGGHDVGEEEIESVGSEWEWTGGRFGRPSMVVFAR